MTWFVIAMLYLGAGTDNSATIESARSLVRSGRVVEALRQLQELEKRSDGDLDVQFEIGDILQELAASRAEVLQKLAPGSPEVHELLGKSFESRQKMEEALAEYKLARHANPSMPGINFLIGNLYYKQRKLDEAKKPLEGELMLNPDHAFANLRMGEILLVTDADVPQKAVNYFRKATADSHTGLEAHRELGKALRLSGRYQEAFQELDWVARQNPDDESVHAQLAALYRAQGDTEKAGKELKIQRKLLTNKHDLSLKAHQVDADHK